jgi:mucin-19
MAQHDYNIANQGFPAFRSDLNNALSAIQTTNSGTSRPSGAVAGQLWLDTTTATSPTLKYYDGADDISLAIIDHTANTVNWLDSTVSITGLSTTATGTVLTLSDTATTSTVNLIIDNDKEIRFREATANGTNYVSLSAPASLSADLTFTLPATDGTNGQVLSTNGSGVLSFTTPSAGISWQSSVKTSGFTAVAGEGYFCNTTSAGFTVTLPASPTAGQQVAVVDYAGTFDTNALIINPNSNKIEGGTVNLALTGEREGVLLVYIDSTQGWLATSGINEGTDALSPAPYSADFLVIAGGGSGGSDNGGGGGAGGYRSSNSSYGSSGGGASAESTLTFTVGTVYTITVGAGGSGATGQGNVGVNSSISGTGITTITSTGGGKGGTGGAPFAGTSGGSGAGGSRDGSGNTGGSGTANQGFAGSAGVGVTNSGGGGGAGEAGGTDGAGEGGDGVASTITGSSVTRAGGGGGVASKVGGTGGGGTGATASPSVIGGDATVNTGSGGGGGGQDGARGGNGGSGVVILRMPTANYSSTTTGSPTVSTSGSDTILVYNASGSYTG